MKLLTATICLAFLAYAAWAMKDNQDEKEAKFFIKSYSTVTWTFLSSFTSIIPYTCYTTAAAPGACTGRRRRRAKKIKGEIPTADGATQLQSSGAEDDDSLVPSVGRDTDGTGFESSPQQERFFFTLWSTASTTVTVTTFSTNRAITISISGLCTYPGVTLNLC